MAEKLVMVGVLPEVMVPRRGRSGGVVFQRREPENRIRFAALPFSSNVFQAPPGMRLVSGPVRPGTNPGSYRYRLSLNEAVVAHGEILLREK